MPLDLSSSASADIKFITRVIDTQLVYLLATDDGVASSLSSEDEQATVLMFWSDAQKARQVQQSGYEEFRIEEIPLFDFLYRWLPGMAEDGALAGVNWDQDLVGTESEALDLAEAIGEAMPAQLASALEAKFGELADDV